MPILEVFQTISILELYLTAEILLVEDLNGDLLLAVVPGPIALFMKIQIILHRPTRKLRLLIHTGRHGGEDRPEGHEDRNCGAYCNEDSKVEATAQLVGYKPGNTDQEGEEEEVGP